MKNPLLIVVILFFLDFENLLASPKNLYAQLCEINQEWKNKAEFAKKYGFASQKTLFSEREILQFHLRFLEKYFREQPVDHLSQNQRTNRLLYLDHLKTYWQMANCPQNTLHSNRIPVFIDEQNRYCAVAYLMFKGGKKEFTRKVQKTANNIYIRQITDPAFVAWQAESGLSLAELAWIQPGYVPLIKMTKLKNNNPLGKITFLDSAATKKIYNFDYDYRDMFGIQRIFMGSDYDLDKQLKKIGFSGIKPNWVRLKGRILEIQLYSGNLYASQLLEDYDQMDTVSGLPKYEAGIYQWKNGNWLKIKELNNRNAVYAMTVYQNKLYLGGGMSYYDTVQTRTFNHSYLATWDGKQYAESNVEYGGYIFGFIYRKPEMLLGIARNSLDDWTGENLPMELPKNPENQALSSENK